MLDLFNQIKAAFEGESDTLAPHELERYKGLRESFAALSFCISDMFIDNIIDVETFSEQLYAPTVNKAKALLLNNFDCEGLNEDEIASQLKCEWLHYYADAIVLELILAHGHSLEDIQNATGAENLFTSESLDHVNQAINAVNEKCFKSFTSYMGYSGSEMDTYRIIDVVDYAKDNNMIENNALEDWFPRAHALAPNGNDLSPKPPQLK